MRKQYCQSQFGSGQRETGAKKEKKNTHAPPRYVLAMQRSEYISKYSLELLMYS